MKRTAGTPPAAQNSGSRGHKDILKDTLKTILPLALSALLVWWIFRKVDFRSMMNLLRHDVDYWWIVLMMIITAFSHAIRGIRWGIQLNGVNVNPPKQALVVSIFGTYALNLVIPRLGEVWRCVFISRRNKVPLSTVVGTLVGDRASDLFVVIALTVLLLAVAGGAIEAFLRRYAVGREVLSVVSDPWLWIGLLLAVGLIAAFFYYFRNYKFMSRIKTTLSRVWIGFKVLFTMHHKWEYTWLTLGIWVCYFLETYVCFFAFPFTRALVTSHLAWGLLPGLVCFVFGSFSMAVPSNGGLGPWNLAVMFGLSLYGIGETDGAAFAMLMWSAQSVMLVLLGIYTMGYVTITGRRRKTDIAADKTISEPHAG